MANYGAASFDHELHFTYKNWIVTISSIEILKKFLYNIFSTNF